VTQAADKTFTINFGSNVTTAVTASAAQLVGTSPNMTVGSPLAFNATNAQITAALSVLSNMTAPGSIVTTQAADGTFTINFGTNVVNVVSADASRLVGFGANVTVASPLAFNASAAQVQTDLTAMSNVGAGNATVALANGVYTISFSTAESAKLAPTGAVTANASGLTGSTHSAVVSTGTNGALILNMGTTNPAVTVDGNGGAVVNLGTNSPTVTSTAANLTLNAGTGSSTLIVNGGATTLAAGGGTTTGAGEHLVNFSGVVISGNALVTIASAATHAARTVLDVAAIQLTANANGTGAIIGNLDLKDNDLIFANGAAAGAGVIQRLLASGIDGGLWDGPGIRSSSAAATANFASGNTAIGYLLNADLGGGGAFDGVSLLANGNDVLVKYTYYGDADLSGSVDITDLGQLDSDFNVVNTGAVWDQADFDYSGGVDLTDVGVFDTNFGYGVNKGVQL